MCDGVKPRLGFAFKNGEWPWATAQPPVRGPSVTDYQWHTGVIMPAKVAQPTCARLLTQIRKTKLEGETSKKHRMMKLSHHWPGVMQLMQFLY